MHVLIDQGKEEVIEMYVNCKTPEELAKALKNEEESICITGDSKEKQVLIDQGKEETVEMCVSCKTPEELAKAVKNKENSIKVTGDLKEKVFTIMITGNVAWGVCAVSLVAAIGFFIATPAATVAATPAGGAASFAAGAAATAAVAATLGSASIAAVAIGVAAGGIGALNSLRDKYKIVEKDDDHIKLERK